MSNYTIVGTRDGLNNYDGDEIIIVDSTLKKMSDLEQNVRNAIQKKENVIRFEGKVDMMEFTPKLKPVSLSTYELGWMIDDIARDKYMLSGSRLLESLYWAPSSKDVDIFFEDKESYEKVRRFISAIAEAKAVGFEPHYYYNYDVMVEIGRYKVNLKDSPVQIDLVLVEKFCSREEAIAMSLLKENRWEDYLHGYHFRVAQEIQKQLQTM